MFVRCVTFNWDSFSYKPWFYNNVFSGINYTLNSLKPCVEHWQTFTTGPDDDQDDKDEISYTDSFIKSLRDNSLSSVAPPQPR